ncbi:MAG: SEL1-like repeat protein [Epsilonproteobacteria bacterium]|nr:SEL1-like repeat protein [Campylobacterota bacterium]
MKEIAVQTYFFSQEEGDGYEVRISDYPQIRGFGDSYDEAYSEAIERYQEFKEKMMQQTTPVYQEALKAYDIKDYAKVFSLFGTIAEQHDGAMTNLAIMHYKGIGTEVDTTQGIDYFHKAQKAGNPTAAFYLGQIYESGAGIERDEAKAAYYFEQNATTDDPNGQYRLGMLLLQSDPKRAMHWLITAAHNDFPAAQEIVTYVSNQEMANPALLNQTFRALSCEEQYKNVAQIVETKIVPLLEKDAGGIELVNFICESAPQIWLKYTGACSGCHLSTSSTADMILKTFEEAIDQKIVIYLV